MMISRRSTIIVAVIMATGALLLLATCKKYPDGSVLAKLPALPGFTGIPEPVKKQLTIAMEEVQQHPGSANLGMLGMVYHANAYYENAVQCYQLAAEGKGKNWKWDYYLGHLHSEMGRPEEAIRHFRKVIRKQPKAYHAWYYAGEGYFNLGDFKQAETSFSRITERQPLPIKAESTTRIDNFPLDVYAHYQLARIYMETGRSDKAEQCLLDIIKSHRSFGPAYRLLGSLYNARQKTDLGNRYTIRANDLVVYFNPVDTLIDRLSLLSSSERYLLKKIDEAEQSGYPEWAMRLITHGFECMPENKYLISKFIKLFLKMNLGKHSSPLLQKHIGLFKDDYNEISSLAYLLYLKGLYGSSLEYYRLARQIRPDDINAQASVIMCLWKTINHRQALDSTLLWLNRSPGKGKVLKEGIDILLSYGQVALSEKYFTALKKASYDEDAKLSIEGKIEAVKGHVLPALNSYEAAFKLNPENLTNTRLLINLLVQLEMWERSVDVLRQALVHHPNESFLLERLGTILISCPDKRIRNIEEGKEYAERAYIHSASEPLTLISAGRSLAVAYASLGEMKMARSTMVTTIKLARQEGMSATMVAELEQVLKALR